MLLRYKSDRNIVSWQKKVEEYVETSSGRHACRIYLDTYLMP